MTQANAAPTVLVTNDDGIHSPGLHTLAAHARDHGFDVIVAAPAREASGSSASITAVEDEGRIRIERREIPGLPGVEAFAVHGTPGFISMIASHGAFGPVPGIVLSGVNRGANVGSVILHSGTVGAALTAGSNGARALAVSLDTGINPEHFEWAVAAEAAMGLMDFLLEHPVGTVLNLNVPNRPGTPFYREASLASFGIVQTVLAERGQQHVRLSISDTEEVAEEGTDFALLAEGFAPVTALQAINTAALRGALPDRATRGESRGGAGEDEREPAGQG
ncbi:5'/3'-nucleotidase SurE [Sinomonas sp.]|uniref:5'/3'-nucleotidase SurE n=1 Tax=Sinomonas sp. TaxID=1914986 RepID=UPI002FE31FA5